MFPFDKQRKVESPIEFVGKDNYRENPISFMDKDINNEYSFAITKLTENGKYVRGNMLFYSLNGVEVYTDMNNIIFVDTINNTLFVREYSKVANEINPEDPEMRQYIMLYVDLVDEDEVPPLRWEAVIGRSNAYESIKPNCPVIDIDKSMVLVDNVALKDALSIRQFVKYIQNANIIRDGFEIDNYSNEYN